MPLSLNHAPANGTNYRIFHGIRYLRCVVRAVRAATEHSNRQVFANRMRLRQQSLRFAAAGMRRTAVICSAYFRVSPPAAPEVPLGTRADRCPSSIGLLLQPVGRAPDGFQPSGGAAPTEKDGNDCPRHAVSAETVRAEAALYGKLAPLRKKP